MSRRGAVGGLGWLPPATQPLAHPWAAWTGGKTAPGPRHRAGDQGFVIPSSEQVFIATSASPASLFVPPLLLPLHVAMLGGFQPWGCSPPRDRVLGKKQGMGRGRLGVPPPSPQHSWEPEGRYRGGMVNPTDHFPPLQEETGVTAALGHPPAHHCHPRTPHGCPLLGVCTQKCPGLLCWGQ